MALKSKQLKILHITPWFHDQQDKHEALFIQEHINALNLYSANEVLCIKIKHNPKRFLSFNHIKKKQGVEYIYCDTKFRRSFITEWIGFVLLFWMLVLKRKHKEFDIINMVIAYPLCVYLKYIRKFVNKPFLLTEHWSVYKYGFYINKNTKGLAHIRKIFSPELPIITVSASLMNDINNFSNCNELEHFVVQNAVNVEIFHFNPDFIIPENPVFFMINKWNYIKKPIIVIEAFEQFLIKYPKARLIIGGYGPMWEEIKLIIEIKYLSKNVKLTGKLDKSEIARYISESTALLQASDYETFSVICAESICCGIPVVASAVGGILSIIDETNGILLNNESVETWSNAMEEIFKHSKRIR